jgi:hypothetical protein
VAVLERASVPARIISPRLSQALGLARATVETLAYGTTVAYALGCEGS